MKIIDQKGRFLGFINIVDLLVLLAFIFAAAAIGVKLFAAPIQQAISPNVTMTTTLRIRGATEFLQDEIERNPLVGKQLVSGTDYIDASIISCEKTDYTNQVITADGQIVNATDPTKKDFVITVESSVAKGTATPKIGTQEVRAGRTMILKTQDFEMNANIVSVTFDD